MVGSPQSPMPPLCSTKISLGQLSIRLPASSSSEQHSTLVILTHVSATRSRSYSKSFSAHLLVKVSLQLCDLDSYFLDLLGRPAAASSYIETPPIDSSSQCGECASSRPTAIVSSPPYKTQRSIADDHQPTAGGANIRLPDRQHAALSSFLPRTVSLAVQTVVRYSQDTPQRSPPELSTPTACGFELQGKDLVRNGIPVVDSVGKTTSRPLEGDCGGQCQSPRQPQREGVQVSMSQRGSAPRPASRRSSPSPARDVASSPNSQQPGHIRQNDAKTRPAHESEGLASSGAEVRRRSRTSGVQVHDILNPSEPQRDSGGSSAMRRPIKEESPPLPRMAPRQHGSERSPPPYYSYAYPPPGTIAPQQHHQQPPSSTIPPPAIPPPLTAARRILTPRSPRAASLSRAASRVIEPQHVAKFSPNTPRNVAPPPHQQQQQHDVSPLSGSPAAGESYLISGPIRGHGTPGPPPNRPTSGLSRSLSQPMIGHGMPTPRQEALQTHGPGRGAGTLPAVYPPASPFTPPAPSGGGLVGQGMMGEWRWGSGPLGPGQAGGSAGPRGLQIAEGHQHMIAITPDHGEKILVPVNTHEGSKQMNEKRQRNAGASARFRHRKKIKDQAMMEEMQKLEAQNRELAHRVRELEEERDFYMHGGRPGEFRPRSRPPEEQVERGERGQSSPGSSRSGGSYTGENSPLPASAPSAPPAQHLTQFSHARGRTQNHPHPPPMSYGDPSMTERPARRRRIDSAPELAALSHGSSPPGSLPPMPHPVYGMPPSPHLAEQSGSARLPPLRFDQPGPSTPTPPPAPVGAPPPPVHQHQQQQQQQQQHHRPGDPYAPYSTASYETGWALEYKSQPESRAK
ncbi:hypothetical protein V8F33_011781 [Rhypophila sp. PSN 637]